MSFFFRRPRPESQPRPSSYDEISSVFAELSTEREPPTDLAPIRRPYPPGIGSPQDHAIHGGKFSVAPRTDGATERDERRRRAMPLPPPSTEPTIDQMRFGPWS
jgi:hypothetical protein